MPEKIKKFMGDPIDFNNPEEMREVFDNAMAFAKGDIDKMAEINTQRRNDCVERGYHRVSSDNKDPLICYDCELFFGKKDSWWIDYRVEPL